MLAVRAPDPDVLDIGSVEGGRATYAELGLNPMQRCSEAAASGDALRPLRPGVALRPVLSGRAGSARVALRAGTAGVALGARGTVVTGGALGSLGPDRAGRARCSCRAGLIPADLLVVG